MLQKNIDNFGLGDRASILKRDAIRFGSAGSAASFDLVFADPPYGKGLGEKAAANLIAGKWLAPQALLVVEENPNSAPEGLPGFERLEIKSYSATTIAIFRISKGFL